MQSQPPVPDPDGRLDEGAARQLAKIRDLLAGGAQMIGWKVGFGSAAARSRLGVNGPLVGYLTDRTLLKSGATCPIGGWIRPLVEAEIAIHIGRDVDPDVNLDSVGTTISGLGAAIEIVDLDFQPDDVARILGENIFHRSYILGPVNGSRAGGDINGIWSRIWLNGVEVASNRDPEAEIGPLSRIVHHVATRLGGLGLTLSAGQVILAGSLVQPLKVSAGDVVRVEIDPLGVLDAVFD